MQQTEKYQFNLIEGSDLFLPEALNENMEKAEQVLAEHRAEASGALAELTASTAARFAVQPKIDVLTWTGDGEKSRTLTFQFQPKAVLFFVQYGDCCPLIAASYGLERGYRSGHANNVYRDVKLAWDGASVKLSENRSESGISAFNLKNSIYLALAIG